MRWHPTDWQENGFQTGRRYRQKKSTDWLKLPIRKGTSSLSATGRRSANDISHDLDRYSDLSGTPPMNAGGHSGSPPATAGDRAIDRGWSGGQTATLGVRSIQGGRRSQTPSQLTATGDRRGEGRQLTDGKSWITMGRLVEQPLFYPPTREVWVTTTHVVFDG